MLRRLLSLGLLLLACGIAHGEFDDDFTGATLRVDIYHGGNAEHEFVSLDSARVEGTWPGSRTQLIDSTNLGLYLLECVDAQDQRLLYSRGFSSIYGEWETTAAATPPYVGIFPEGLRLPEPRRPVVVRLRKRSGDGVFRELWAARIDPASRHVHRAAPTDGDVVALGALGPLGERVDLLLLGDGYTTEEREKFLADARRMSDALFREEPFASRRDDFNVRALFSPAPESGISRPRSGQFRHSPLGTSYNAFDSERYVLSLDDRAWRDIAAAAPYDFIMILLNSEKYGGGGIFQLYATAAADSSFADYLFVHEFGHSFASLADEYYTSPVAYEEGVRANAEPWEPNVTALLDPGRIKWSEFVDSETPLPTEWDQQEYGDWSRSIQARRAKLRDAGAAESELEELFEEERRESSRRLGAEKHAGAIGAFEGAMYQAQGLYRPAADCMMFTRNKVGFCAVCRHALERVIDLYSK